MERGRSIRRTDPHTGASAQLPINQVDTDGAVGQLLG